MKFVKVRSSWAGFVLPVVLFTGTPVLSQPLDQIHLYTPIECHPGAYTGNWVNTGPFDTSPHGPNLGQIHAIAVHPQDTNIIYAGAPNGGMWKTTDGGKHWKSLFNFETLPPLGVRAILINPQNPDVVIAATSAGIGIWAQSNITDYGTGVIVSFDGGKTWEQTRLRFDPTGPFEWYGQLGTFKLDFLPQTSADTMWLVAMTKNQVYRLNIIPHDREGETCEAVIGGIYDRGRNRDIETHPEKPVIWLATTEGLKRSSDNGKTWQTLRAYHVPEGNYSHYHDCPWDQTNHVAMFIKYRMGCLFMLHELRDDSCQNKMITIQYSRDLGDTWEGFHAYPNEPRSILNTFNIFDVSETDSSIYVRGTGSYVIKLGLDLKPKPMSAARTHVDPRGFLITRFGGKEILYQGNDGGINISTDHRNWRDITGTGLGMGQYYGIGCDPNDIDRYIAGAQDGSVNAHLYGRWTNVSGGDNGDAIFHPRDSNIIFFSSNNALTRSTNGGKGFSTLKVGDHGHAMVLFPMAMHPNYPDTLFVGFHALWRTDEASTGKTQSFSAVHDPYGKSIRISSVEICRADPDVVYYAYNMHHYSGGDTVKGLLFRTTDGGLSSDSWKDITGSLGRSVSHDDAPLKRGPVHDIVTDPDAPSRVWVCFGGFGDGRKVYYSPDMGETWQNMSAGLPNLPANTLVYQRGSDDRLYLGMDGGVYYWEKDSARWYRYCGGFPNAIVMDMEIHECGNLLRVATFGRGIWEVNLIPGEPLQVRGDITTWSGMRTVTQDIVVRKKSTLVVTGTLNMAQGYGITLEKRAKLIVDGGLITNNCGCRWDGVRQHPKAKVEVRNGGAISKAVVGL